MIINSINDNFRVAYYLQDHSDYQLLDITRKWISLKLLRKINVCK